MNTDIKSLQDALKQPLCAYEALATSTDSSLQTTLIKILIDYKSGRLRQAMSRYRLCLETQGFDTTVSILEQDHALNEASAPLLIFELIFTMTNVAHTSGVDTDAYIETLDFFRPDDRVFQGGIYNTLLASVIRDGKIVIAQQFAELALQEYRAANAPYLEAFIHLHLAFVHIYAANYPLALDALQDAQDCFSVVSGACGEITQVEMVRAWVNMEYLGTCPEQDCLLSCKKTMLSGELWSETFLVLATVLFRAGVKRDRDNTLATHAELETVMRIRRMTALLPAMQLLRAEYFEQPVTPDKVSTPLALDELQLLLLQPTPDTLLLNWGVDTARLAPDSLRLQATLGLLQGKLALKNRQFSQAAQAIWPALSIIEQQQMLGLLTASQEIVTDFLAECRARRRFVEKARHVRDSLLSSLRKPVTVTQLPPELTAAEFAVLTLLPEATSNKGIARELGIGESTVKFHLRNIYRKLGVHRRRDAIKAADAKGWVNTH